MTNSKKELMDCIPRVIAFLCLFAVCGSSCAQNSGDLLGTISALETSESPGKTIPALEDLDKSFQNGDWEKMPKEQKERATVAFLKQLKKGGRVAQTGESEVANRYVKLLGDISWRIHDDRVIPVLIDGLNGHYQNALVKIGKPAVKSLADRFGENSVAGTENGKLFVLRIYKRMGPSVVGAENVDVVKQILIKASADDDIYVRQAAVNLLGDFGSKDEIQLLEKIENNDPGYVDGATSSEKTPLQERGKKFLVREEATQTLKKIRTRMRFKTN